MSESLRSFVTEHAEVRARARLGRWLTTAHWHAIANQILVEGGVLLKRQAPNREVWAVQLGGLVVHVVWEPGAGKLITVLADPQEFARAKRRGRKQ